MDKHVLDKDAVSKRILQTTRETERLKEELQNLITAGLKGNSDANAGISPEKNSLQSSNKVQIIKSYDSKHSVHPEVKSSGTAAKQNEGNTSPKKVKKYNVSQAREFIKKQKEKRQAESKKTETKTTTELRKEKLQELQQKATELVKKNVEAKRQRSKSREQAIVRSKTREPPILRARSTSKEPPIRARSKSKEAKANLKHSWADNDNLERRSPRDSIIHGSNCAGRSKNYYSSNLEQFSIPVSSNKMVLNKAKSCEQLHTLLKGRNPNLLYPIDYRESETNLKSAKLPDNNFYTESQYLTEAHLCQKESNMPIPKDPDIVSEKLNKSSRSRKDIFLRDIGQKLSLSKSDSTEVNRIEPITKFSKHETSPSLHEEKKKVLIHSNITLRSANDNKVPENQESSQDYPDWLKYSSGQTDPYNFINTVRRQLKFAVNEKIPCTMDDPSIVQIEQNNENVKSEKTSKKTDLKSFISHKCLNLDPRAIDHIEIGSKKITPAEQNTISTKSRNNSESDTSKNIPSISSESRISSLKNTDIKGSYYLLAKVSSKSDESNTHKSDHIIELLKARPNFSESNSSHISTDISAKSQSHSKKKHSKSSRTISKSDLLSSDKHTIADINSDANTDSNKENINHLSLIEPKSSLKLGDHGHKVRTYLDKPASLKNISVRSDRQNRIAGNTNQIHLKFEAEIHLLNDFNKSLRHFAEIEKEFEALRLRNDSELMTKKILLNRDTQTSIANPSLESSSTAKTSMPTSHISTINYSRGSFCDEQIQNLKVQDESHTASELNLEEVTTSADWRGVLSNTTTVDGLSEKTNSVVQYSSRSVNKTETSNVNYANDDNVMFRDFAGVSLKMFDQLIKDEDVRIENLKRMVKIREQVLLDKTRSELVWLEIQKKQFIETKKFEEASLIKRRQRGILLRHQQEKQEMHKLKQMQKEASKERKTALKQQRKGIKNQLLSGNVLSILKPSSRERRTSGPLKVIQTNSIRSETSLSVAATATDQEIKSITSRTRSMVNILPAPSEVQPPNVESMEVTLRGRTSISDSVLANTKQKLLMRERALAKRKQTVEGLLRWHHNLLQEERVIEELEDKVKSIVSKIPSEREEDKSNLEPSCSSPVQENIPLDQKNESTEADRSSRNTAYSEHFEPDDVSSISSISQIIDDLNKIEGKILNFSLAHSVQQNEEYRESSLPDRLPSQLPAKSSDDTIQQQQPVASNVLLEEDNTPVTEQQTVENPPKSDSDLVITIEDSSKLQLEEQSETEQENIVEQFPSPVIDNVVPEDSINLSDRDDELKTVDSSRSQTPNEIKSELSAESTKELEDGHLPESEKSVRTMSELPQPSTSLKDLVNMEDDVSSYVENEPSDSSTASKHEQIVEQLDEFKENSASTSYPPSSQILSENENVVQDFLSENKTDEEKAASLTTTKHSSSLAATNSQSIEESSSSSSVPSVIETPLNLVGETSEMSSLQEEIVFADKTARIEHSESPLPEDAAAADSSTDSLESVASETSRKSDSSSGTSSKPIVDVKKRVQEILSDVGAVSRGEKSPRMQDLCVMTYDLISPTQSPESDSPLDERKSFSLGSEAEELLKKQLAIEQEIKLLTEQQQKEQMPLVYIREIPNKPPPPYTPPSKTKPIKVTSIIPSSKEEVERITEYSAKIIHKAYLSKNLDNISISDKTLSLIAKNIDKGCFKYVFDLCKEIAIAHYNQFLLAAPGPSWLQLEMRPFSVQKPLDVNGLQRLMNRKLLELFGFHKQETKRENTIMKWSRKKRDHVDEVLIQEMQGEEASWTNFDRDELLVRDRVTSEIMNLLLKETAQVLQETILKKSQNQ